MLRIDDTTVAGLRDRLKERGERPSLFAMDLAALARNDVPPDVLLRFDALCEVMFLMAMADGTLAESEEDTLRGAIRELSDGTVRSVHIRSMTEGAQARLAKEGSAARVKAVAAKLRDDPPTAEAAFALAAAIAFADDEIADEENALLNDFAEALGLDAEAAEQLLDELHIGASAS
jgi:tellurite resistance protein